MKINSIYIKKYKNLINSYISFSQNSNSFIVIGENGSGKSNLIEAISIIFRNIDLDEPPEFEFEIKYEIRKRKIEIKGYLEKLQKHDYFIDGITLPKNRIREYLPKYIIAYYSGINQRLAKVYEEHKKRYKQKARKQDIKSDDFELRRLFYTENFHSQFIILSLFSFIDQQVGTTRKIIESYFKVKRLDSVLFVLKEPYWYNEKLQSGKMFWGAQGIVKEFLEDLFSYSLAPIHKEETFKYGNEQIKKQDTIYLFIKDDNTLRKFAKKYSGNLNLFKLLESTYIYDMVHEIRIMVETVEGNKIIFSELSEGEQQLLSVLGLMKFINTDDALFLLDEPDTHLNPKWKADYFDLVQDIVELNDNTQVIINTHDPIFVANQSAKNIIALEKNGQRRVIDEEPQYLGIAGVLLNNDFFGLKSLLGTEMQNYLEEKRRIVIKEEKNDEDLQRLKELNGILKDIDLTIAFRDPLYNKFVKAKTKLVENAIVENDIETLKKLLDGDLNDSY
jgi:Recombinational DNA repair ATPase (RecF pathway)